MTSLKFRLSSVGLMKRFVVVASLAPLHFAAVEAIAQSGDGYVGIYSDSAGTISCTHVAPWTGATLYVVAKLAGASASGITGAELRVEVTRPTGWYLSYNAPAGGQALGNPIGAGVNLVFAACRSGAAGAVGLGTINVFNAGGDSTKLLIKRHTTPYNANFQCPLFTLCDSPAFSKICMTQSTEPPCSPTKPSGGGAGSMSEDPPVFTTSLDTTSAGLPPGGPGNPTIEPLATVNGDYGTYSPWSPTQPLFAYRTHAGLFVLDATNPGAQPVQVFQGGLAEYNWSPDGNWLLLITASQAEKARNLVSLVAVPATGGSASLVIDKADVGNFVWGTDGYIYYWEKDAPRSRRLAPPAAWAAMHAGPFAGRPELILATDEATREEKPYYFHAGLPEKAHLITPSYVSPGSPTLQVMPRDGFPDGRLLISAFGQGEGDAGATLIVDAQGALSARLGTSWGETKFTGTSVSPDGSFVAGDQVIDDGHAILSAKLYVVAATNAWRLRVGNIEGMNPQLSRVGSFMAYTDRQGMMVHVCTLQFNY